MPESSIEHRTDSDLMVEFDLLEKKIQEAARVLARLREEKAILEKECERLRDERTETVHRLSRLVEKIDSLGGGH